MIKNIWEKIRSFISQYKRKTYMLMILVALTALIFPTLVKLAIWAALLIGIYGLAFKKGE